MNLEGLTTVLVRVSQLNCGVQAPLVHTNTIEGEWSLLKKQYKIMNGTSEELFETYIYEFVFRKFFPNNFFGHFVQWVNTFYGHN